MARAQQSRLARVDGHRGILMTSRHGGPRRPHPDFRTMVNIEPWLRQSNLYEAGQLASLLNRVDVAGSADERAARVIGVLQRGGFELSGRNVEHVARLMGMSVSSRSLGTSPSSLQTVRELATAHADWRGAMHRSRRRSGGSSRQPCRLPRRLAARRPPRPRAMRLAGATSESPKASTGSPASGASLRRPSSR